MIGKELEPEIFDGVELNFEILKDSSNEIIGFSLIAGAQTDAEIFCSQFINWIKESKESPQEAENSGIYIQPGEIVFELKNQEKHSFPISRKEEIELRKIFTGKKGRVSFERAGFFTPGFKFVVKR